MLACLGTERRRSTQVLMEPTMAHKRTSTQRNVKGLTTARQMVMACREIAYGMMAGCPNSVRALASRLPVCHRQILHMPIVYRTTIVPLSDEESALMKANKSVMEMVIASQSQEINW